MHLTGEPVRGRWTPEKRRTIRDSRVVSTRQLVAALRALKTRPRVLVTASAVGYYGDRGDQELTETSPPGSDFLAEVCVAAEEAARRAEEAGVRVVSARFGLVLGRGGGALEALLPLYRTGMGGRLGPGRQWWPWVHLDDVSGIVRHAIEREELVGPVNATAPTPVRQSEFAKALGKALRRPTLLPAPAFLLKAVIGDFARELLASRRVLPRVAEAGGYRFRHASLPEALADLIDDRRGRSRRGVGEWYGDDDEVL